MICFSALYLVRCSIKRITFHLAINNYSSKVGRGKRKDTLPVRIILYAKSIDDIRTLHVVFKCSVCIENFDFVNLTFCLTTRIIFCSSIQILNYYFFDAQTIFKFHFHHVWRVAISRNTVSHISVVALYNPVPSEQEITYMKKRKRITHTGATCTDSQRTFLVCCWSLFV